MANKFRLDPGLRPYATDRQWQMLEAWDKLGSRRKAAKELGVALSTLQKSKERVSKKAAQKGYAPEFDLVHPVAPGMSSRGTSILYDGEGNVHEYWNKSKQEGRDPDEVVHLPDPKTIVKLSTLYDQEGNVTQQWIAEKPEAVAQARAWEEYAKALAEDLPRVKPIPVPWVTDENIMACYPVGDHHLGMLSWNQETGADYDLKIGEELLASAANYLIEKSGDAKDALVLFLGDFMHYDSFKPVTPTSGNLLDADSRFPKMVRAAIRSMRYFIERCAEVHEKVHVVVEIGNHDLSSSIFLMEALKNIYENDSRITVDTSPKHFHYFRYGNNLIGTHHGHGRHAKLADLPLIMATDKASDWGETRFHYWFTGHVHHDQVKDFPGCRVESVRVLAAEDAWAAQEGYRSKRDMKAIIFDKEFGEIARHTINPEKLRDIKQKG